MELQIANFRLQIQGWSGGKKTSQGSSGEQIPFGSCAQVGRQAVHGADEIGNRIKRRGPTPCRAGGALQPLANDVGLRTPTPARFQLDLGDEQFGQSYG